MFLLLFFMLLSVKVNKGVEDMYRSKNWTSCDEFLRGTTFNPTSVIDINWKIFYFWHIEYEKSYQIRFSIPSDELIRRFRVELDGSMRPPVDWSDAEFFMETSIDVSALYLRTNISGLYRIVPAYAFKLASVPIFQVGLKIIEPGYLGLMNCQHRLCYALAPVEQMPPDDEIEQIAKRINFQSDLNYTYVKSVEPVATPENDEEGDQDDEIEQDLDKFDFIL